MSFLVSINQKITKSIALIILPILQLAVAKFLDAHCVFLLNMRLVTNEKDKQMLLWM